MGEIQLQYTCGRQKGTAKIFCEIFLLNSLYGKENVSPV